MVTAAWPDTMESADRLKFAKNTTNSPSSASHAPLSTAAESVPTPTPAPAPVQKAVEISARTGKPKRRKALRACGNCQRTHLTCDDNRPCERCIKRGCADTCADGVRKKMKYLDKNSRESHAGLNGTYNVAGLHPVYTAPGEPTFGHASRGSVSSLGPDGPVPIVGMGHPAQVPLMHPHSHVGPPHVDHVDGMLLHRDMLGAQQPDFVPDQNVMRGRQQSMTAQGLGPHHALPVAPVPSTGPGPGPGPVAPAGLPVLSAESDDSANYTTTTAAAAGLAAPAQDRHSFHSYAADSEYTVVARMLENSRAKSDRDYSPADSPKFSSSNVDLRNFVTLQPPQQDPSHSPADAGYTSWLDPPPPPPPAVVVQRRKSGMQNVKRVDSDGSDQSIGKILPLPSDIYRNVHEPYPYTPAFHGLITFLKQRFARDQLMRIVRSMARIRPSFIAVTKDLTHEDLVFMEQCFQRSLLEYEKYFAYSGTPSIVWRRTGQIAAVAPEFCMLTQWPRHELRSRFIVEVMSDESAVDYFERFSEMTFTDTKGQIMYECSLMTPMGQQIRTSAVLTVRKDLFGIPMTIIGNFLPHV